MLIGATAERMIETSKTPSKRRSLMAACLAHALHDGYTDGLYPFLPLWQSQFGLSYAGLAIVRALYYGCMGGLQLPGAHLFRRLSPRAALVLSTLIAAVGFIIMAAAPLGFAGLCIGLVIAGAGSSLQHPRGSLLVTEAFAPAARGALGVYNFSGDLGKAALPAIAAVLLPFLAWRPVIGLMALLGLLISFALLVLTPLHKPAPKAVLEPGQHEPARSGFALLMTIGAFDTATRMGYLLFLPFMIHARGGSTPAVGLGLAFLFIGGALGKATCSWLAQRFGVVASVVMTEAATAVLIIATLYLPLAPMFVALPLLGVALNGTASVLYGTVPELAPRGDAGRAFALFYTAVIGAGGLAPIAYGLFADASNRTLGVFAAAATAALTVPMVLALAPSLSSAPSRKNA